MPHEEPFTDIDQDAQQFEVADPSAHINQSAYVDIGEPDPAPKKSSGKKKLIGFVFILLAGGLGAASFIFGGGNGIITADSNIIKSENSGSIVFVTGEISAKENIDPMFQVSSNGTSIKRMVEIYQWAEEDGKLVQKWSEKIIALTGDEAKSKNLENPKDIPIVSEKFGDEEIKIGAFTLDPSIAEKASMPSDVPLSKDTFAKLDSEGQQAFKLYQDKYYFFGADPEKPQVGDFRISFSKNDGGTFSILAKQQGSQLVAGTSSDGIPIAKVMPGKHTIDEISVGVDAGGSSIITWIMRGGAGFLFLISFVMMLGKSGPKAPKPAKEKKTDKLRKENTQELLASLSQFAKESSAAKESAQAEQHLQQTAVENSEISEIDDETSHVEEDFYPEPEPTHKPAPAPEKPIHKDLVPLEFETNTSQEELLSDLSDFKLPELPDLPEFHAHTESTTSFEAKPEFGSIEEPMPFSTDDVEIPDGVEIIGGDIDDIAPKKTSPEIPLPPFAFDEAAPKSITPSKPEVIGDLPSLADDEMNIPENVEIIEDAETSEKPISVRDLLGSGNGLDFDTAPNKETAELKTHIPTFVDNPIDEISDRGLDFTVDDIPLEPEAPTVNDIPLPPSPEDEEYFEIEEDQPEEPSDDEDDDGLDEILLDDDDFEIEDDEPEDDEEIEEDEEDDDDDFVPLPPPPPILNRKPKVEASNAPVFTPEPAPMPPVQKVAPTTGGLSFELPNIPDDFDPTKEMDTPLPEENHSDEDFEDFSHTDDDNFSPFDIKDENK